MTTTPNLNEYAYILVNSSGGKDSQTALRRVIRLADEQGCPRDNIVVVHCDLGDMEWEGTKELAEAQAKHYGLEFIVVRRRTAEGVEESLLDYAERRGKWPSSTQRWCTSDFKRGPAGRAVTAVSKRVAGEHKILQVFGFRAEESPARAKREEFSTNARLTTKTRTVHDWLPIHDWNEEQVWLDIVESGVPYHKAYDLGMPRLSCVFCIFAPKAALIIAGKHNRELLDRYCETEQKIGHTFTKALPIVEVREAVERGDEPEITEMTSCWNM